MFGYHFYVYKKEKKTVENKEYSFLEPPGWNYLENCSTVVSSSLSLILKDFFFIVFFFLTSNTLGGG